MVSVVVNTLLADTAQLLYVCDATIPSCNWLVEKHGLLFKLIGDCSHCPPAHSTPLSVIDTGLMGMKPSLSHSIGGFPVEEKLDAVAV